MDIHHLADADGHIIEPGHLWVERLPVDLRPMAPHYYRDDAGVFHSRIYGIEIDSLPVMHGGISPKDMLDNMGLSCAMGMPLERVFSASSRATVAFRSRKTEISPSGRACRPSTGWPRSAIGSTLIRPR